MFKLGFFDFEKILLDIKTVLEESALRLKGDVNDLSVKEVFITASFDVGYFAESRRSFILSRLQSLTYDSDKIGLDIQCEPFEWGRGFTGYSIDVTLSIVDGLNLRSALEECEALSLQVANVMSFRDYAKHLFESFLYTVRFWEKKGDL